MADAYCGDCKRFTEVVSDHAAGDTVCSECGLVLEAHSIDETSEWRTFANESGDHDPNRVGGPSNPLLADSGLYTVISGPRGDALPSSLGRWQNRASNSERNLLSGFKTIATMADRLLIVGTIKDRANEIYKKVEDLKSVKGRNLNAVLAACLYIACRQEGSSMTVKEICLIADGASMKDIGRAKEFIIKQIGVDDSAPIKAVNASDIIKRKCSLLGMSNHCVKAAHEAVLKAEELDIRRTPGALAAAVIYMIVQLSDDKKPLKEIAVVTQVAEGTIKNAYKDLYPHASRIIPTSFAKEEDLKKLCIP